MQSGSTETSAPIGLRRRLFSALSWRMETRLADRPAVDMQRARDRFGHVLYWSGAHRSLPALTDRAAILCFHGLGAGRLDAEIDRSILHVRGFVQILRVLKRSFRVLPLAELVECLQAGRQPPPKSVVITFDDGYASNLEIAAPELAALGLPWSSFLPAGFIESGERRWTDDLPLLVCGSRRSELSFHLETQKLTYDLSTPGARADAIHQIPERCRYAPEALLAPAVAELRASMSADELDSLRRKHPEFAPLTWAQASQLRSAGVELGSHSVNHVALAVQTTERIREEIRVAEELFKRHIGPPSPHFSYPYGNRLSFSAETADLLRAAGYRCALTLVHEMVPVPLDDLMCMPRLIVSAQPGRTLTLLWQRFNG
jgi:peptidoglycan/xylan/chitin deacetylase (PgdA/CDA1 family)